MNTGIQATDTMHNNIPVQSHPFVGYHLLDLLDAQVKRKNMNRHLSELLLQLFFSILPTAFTKHYCILL